ncbi:hypothetical protein FQA39_LY06863 [Lamprigera yunnana]|nr:hypothetical protein FQA39_LY06863 [Lamprigera yunnana]
MIAKELLAMARTAHNAYSNYLEAEKQKKDENKKLSTAIKSKEVTSNGSVAKVLETAIKSHEKKQESEKKIIELQRKILERKKNTLDNFLIVVNKRQATKAPDSDSD